MLLQTVVISTTKVADFNDELPCFSDKFGSSGSTLEGQHTAAYA